MSDVDRYVEKRKKHSARFGKGFEAGYRTFEFSVMLREAGQMAGVTQEMIARKLRTKKSSISRPSGIPPRAGFWKAEQPSSDGEPLAVLRNRTSLLPHPAGRVTRSSELRSRH
jgi:hypothetical protein